MRFMKPTAALLTLVVAAISLAGTAEARDRYRHRHHHHHGGDALAAGVFGFAAGAILSGALAPRYSCGPGYVFDRRYGCVVPLGPVDGVPPPVVYEPAEARYDHPEPWTPEWFAYCDDRYDSFNVKTGYFLGFDGRYHFCR